MKYTAVRSVVTLITTSTISKASACLLKGTLIFWSSPPFSSIASDSGRHGNVCAYHYY